MKRLFLVAPLILTWISCEKEIPLEQEEIQPRIVVNGIFSAGDTIHIHLSESRDVLFEGTLPNLTNASAQLMNENDVVLGTFVHQADGYYTLNNYIPQVGNIYKIKVTNTGFDDVSATTYTPDIITVNTIDTLRKNDYMTYEIKFNDDASEQNYYALTLVKYSIEVIDGEVYYSEDHYFYSSEIFIQNGYSDVDGTKSGNIFLFSDATFNGQECSFSAEHYLAQGDTTLVVVGLRSVSEDYFKYNVSFSKYEETQGDPFAQPVQVYSNVDKGYGIFGAYSLYSDTLTFY